MAIIDSIVNLTPLTSSLNDLRDDVKSVQSKITNIEECFQILLKQQEQMISLLNNIQTASETTVSISPQQVNATAATQSGGNQAEQEQHTIFTRKKIYYGSPQLQGFALGNELESSDSPKALYEVNQDGPETATFHVLDSKYQRLKLNVGSLLNPVCQVNGNPETSMGIRVVEDGKLQKTEMMWSVLKPCVVEFQ